MTQRRVLIECADKKGLVYKVSSLFYAQNLNILSNREYVDRDKERFFMRSVVSGECNCEALQQDLENEIGKDAIIKIVDSKKKNITIFATKESHALGDILIRYNSNELDANIKAVISNHNSLRDLVEKFDIPYFNISAQDLSREAHEQLILERLSKLGEIDYIVLAKYMRILTPEFVGQFENKIINIHHSFLPAFVGANPYKQAQDRGVKIIGATAHFVNNDLDEGPIIAQDVKHVDHAYNWQDMQKLGKDIEKIVLSKALKLALEDRIFVHSNKTIIF